MIAAIGTFITAVGAGVLFFVFRGFGGKRPGSDRHLALIVGLVGFIFVCCFGLFAYSFLLER